MDMIVRKRFGRYREGDTMKLTASEAGVLVALGIVAEVPPVVPVAALLTPKREYKRRDLAPTVTKDEPKDEPKVEPFPLPPAVTPPAWVEYEQKPQPTPNQPPTPKKP
jgi:hypothetical protein